MTLDHITIVLPFPHSMLFPNRRRGSFRKFQPFIEQARRDGFMAAKLALGRSHIPLGKRARMDILFAEPDWRGRDWDGMTGAFKHYQDGIATALGVNDKIFRPINLDFAVDTEKCGFVRVDIFTEAA